MADSKKIDDGAMPKVFLTEEQWAHLRRSENERTRDQIRHNAEVRELLQSFAAFLPKPDAEADKRDWFAGQALAGLIPAYQAAYSSPTAECVEVVQEAYGYADIMIAARKGGVS